MVRGQLGTVSGLKAQNVASQVAKAANLSVWLRGEIGKWRFKKKGLRKKEQLARGSSWVEHMLSTRQAPSSVLSTKNNRTAASGVSLRLRALWMPALPHVEKPSLRLSRASSSLWSWSGLQFQSKKDECPLA